MFSEPPYQGTGAVNVDFLMPHQLANACIIVWKPQIITYEEAQRDNICTAEYAMARHPEANILSLGNLDQSSVFPTNIIKNRAGVVPNSSFLGTCTDRGMPASRQRLIHCLIPKLIPIINSACYLDKEILGHNDPGQQDPVCQFIEK